MSAEQNNDELCRLWRGAETSRPDKEVQEIMRQVETRAAQFERKIHQRNLREYIAGAFVAVVFGWIASIARAPVERLGYAIVSAGALWIIVFAWLMQRSRQAPPPDSPGEVYRQALLARYDRQILLTRTAWAWYVLPLTSGLVIANLGREHAPEIGFVIAGIMVVFGLAVAWLNWRAANAISAEKKELRRLLGETE